jgi:hypothetical protein
MKENETENLRKEQLADHVWGPVVKYLEGDAAVSVPTFAMRPEFYLENGILY